MTIPFSDLVSVLPRTIGGGLSGQDFNGLFLTENANATMNDVLSLSSLTAVADYFGTSSEEYSLAQNYFSADDNSSKKPSALLFARYANSAVSAFVRGAKYAGTLEQLKAIKTGLLTITIDGEKIEATNIDLSSTESFSGVAGVITTALNSKGSCSFNSEFGAFVIRSATSGKDSTMSFAEAVGGEDLGAMLNLQSTSGAILSQGADTETLTARLYEVLKINQKFVTLMPVWNESDAEAKELAEFVNSKGTRFIYAYTEASNAPTIGETPTCFAQLHKSNYGLACMYNSKDVSAMMCGVVAAIDWSAYNGRKTLAYKKQAGLAVSVTDEQVATNLLNNGYNFYGAYGNASNDLDLFQNGQISGSAKWIDTYCGQIYIADSLQNAWINIMSSVNTIPYNADGYALLRAAAQDTINAAVNNGVIVKGVALSQAQKATVMSEAGLDISDELETNGYYLQILDPTAEVRANRGTPIINLWYTDGGSVQRINASSTTIL